jgi:DNA-binding NarL/FixJ family response regulator
MSVYVVDKHPLMRHAIANLFRKLPFELTVIEDKSVDDLISLADGDDFPSLISMDANADVLEDIKQLKQKFPTVFIVVISEQPAEKIESNILLSGADFYFEKTSPTEEISRVLRYLLSTVYEVKDNIFPNFTKRQVQLLHLVDRGLSNQEIASDLNIKLATVKAHLSQLYRTIGVKNRSAAVLHVRRSNSSSVFKTVPLSNFFPLK